MPAEKRHGTGLRGEQEALGANWKSAQCVTSLYESYVQLQQENETLREDAQLLQQQNELLQAQIKNNQLREPEEARAKELEQEVRLLCSEKLRVEEKHRLELQQLEGKVVNTETQNRQLVAKYQERFEFDPLESKRAALAVKTMQNTLQSAMLEKEELGIRYGELKEQFRKFHAEQLQVIEGLQLRVKAFEQQRVRMGQQRVVNALAQWSTNKVQTAWGKWLAQTKEKKLLEANEKTMKSLEAKVDDRVQKIRGSQAATLAVKLLQQAARRSFLRWRELARRNVERRHRGSRCAEERAQRRARCVLRRWRQESRKAKDHRDAALKMERLLNYRRRCWGMRKWSVQTFRLALVDRDRALDAVNGSMELQVTKIIGLERALEAERSIRRELETRYEEDQAATAAKMETHRAAELAVRQKLRRLFTRRFDRQHLKDAVREWKATARQLRGVRQRSDLVQSKLRALKLRRSVLVWHCRAHQSRTKRVQTQQILGRMRQLGVLKCFNTWKERVNEAKARKTTLLFAVNRLRNRGVSRCFTRWTAFRAQRTRLRSALNVLARCALKQQLFFTYSRWRERVVELKLAAQVKQQQVIQQAWEKRLIQAKHELNFQRECFTHWYDAVLQKRRHDAVVRRCVARLQNGSVARMLGSWRAFVERRKKQRELVRRWVARCHTGVQQRAWSRWQRQLVLKEQQLLMLRLQGERDAEMKRLESDFTEYRHAQSALLEDAERAQTAQELKLKQATARLQAEAKRAQRLADAVETLCSTRERESTLVRGFKAWQKAARRATQNRRAVDVFQRALAARQARAVLLHWTRFTTQQKQLRAVFTAVQSCFARWWQRQCVEAWREARRRSRAVAVFSTLFARSSELLICREAFSGWRDVAKKNHLLRRTLEQIWLGSVHAKMRQQFAHWAALTKAQAASEQLERRNAALTAIRAKVWWKQSVSSMRLCFSEWQELVTARKKRRLGERKLLVLQHTRLVALSFSSWAEFVLAKGKTEERNNRFGRWARKLMLGRQARAMATWKMAVMRDQLQELRELKTLRSAQQEALQLQQEEISELTHRAAVTKLKLEDALVLHDEARTTTQHLTRCGLVAKCFNALKLTVFARQCQLHAVRFCHKNARRRLLAELFSSWCGFSQTRKAVKLVAAQRAKHWHDFHMRTVLRRWQGVALQLHVCKQKQHKLRQRARRRVVASCFAQWRRSIHVERSVVEAVERLEMVVRRLHLKTALSTWRQRSLEERRRVTREREKRQKIMNYLMGRQEAGLVRCFHGWKEFTLAKQAPRLQAQQQYASKCLVVLMKCWDCWKLSVRTVKLQRKAVQRMQAVNKRYYCRDALSKWRRYRFLSHIAGLERGNEQLKNQVEESTQRLRSTTRSVGQLSSEVVELQHKLHEAESRSSAVSSEVTAQNAKRSQQLKCLNALSKLIVKRVVSKELSNAFTRWKTTLDALRRQHKALASLARMRRRRKRLAAFWRWKVKTLRWRQLASLKTLWGRNDLLSVVQRWRRYATTQAKLRLFLTRRCLLSHSSQCVPLSMAFRLWGAKSAELAALQHARKLQTTLRNEQDASSTHLRRLALAKWCWMAYNHRLRQMRAFLSRCYASSTKSNAIRHRRAMEEMQLDSAAVLNQVKEQSEARAQEEKRALTAAEEQLTTGASFQALQTLIRRLFQPTTVNELFVSVASTFAQILHGSAAVLFLFDPSSSELWTQREEKQLIQVPASLGIAGSTLSSGATLLVADVSADPRFHPMVDQFVLSGLRQDDATSALMMAASRPGGQAAKPTVGMVSSALVSSDGAVYGVLQVAFPTASLSPIDRRVLVTQTQLYSKTCCFFGMFLLFYLFVLILSSHFLVVDFFLLKKWSSSCAKCCAIVEIASALELQTSLLNYSSRIKAGGNTTRQSSGRLSSWRAGFATWWTSANS
jgi:hypothetical protein